MYICNVWDVEDEFDVYVFFGWQEFRVIEMGVVVFCYERQKVFEELVEEEFCFVVVEVWNCFIVVSFFQVESFEFELLFDFVFCFGSIIYYVGLLSFDDIW